ncbi:hypothetical protein A3K86_01965 [Photobacterium jeanii]|uniref:DUF2860 domain-containing protein n=1 Tax=Photobacterium jeanii TaxID=858640 RepID=A0A178KK67_9GAMM|nr:DUF2860 domain-containing protein [Photobacterium jeanii]OAN17709.1 hypothetical protein A3K86_01965 [Photobacterium jeanii]PST92632.1 DUF2860 domain-containing protein [Photobacterium jeanii]
MKGYPLICLALLSSYSYAQRPDQNWEPGIGGEISVITGYTRSTSQFNTDNKTLSSPDQKASTQSSFLIAPLGTLDYTFASADKQIFFGTRRSDVALGRFHLELGYRQKFEDAGIFSFSYVPGLLKQKTWADPFILNEDREETKVKTRALRLTADNIMGSNFSAELAVGNQSYDSEKSGFANFSAEDQKLLNREGNVAFTEGSYSQFVGRGMILRGALNYTRIDSEGEAMAHDIYGSEVSVIQMMRSSSFILTLSYDYADFNAINPVFDKKQKDHRWGAFLAYEYREPFGWKDWSAISLLGYNQSQSNITFYDEDSLLATVGLDYKF